MSSLVFSNMLHRPARTVVSIIGIGIGILLVIFTVGLANGSLRERAKRDSNVGAEILLRPPGSMGIGGSDGLVMPVSLAAEIQRIDGVQVAVPIATVSVQSGEGLTGSRLIDGIDFDSYSAISGLKVLQGRKFVDGKDEMMADQGWLDGRKLKIGDKFQIFEKDFEITGTYDLSVGSRIKIPLTTLQEQMGAEGKASAILVKIRPGSSPQVVGDRIHEAFPENQMLLTSELEELYIQSIPALNVFLDVVIGVAAIVSGLIILLTMYTTVTERTRQIGVLKSLGMSKFKIAWTIVQEALLLSLGGVLFGVAATIGLKALLGKVTSLSVTIEPLVVLTVVLVGLVSGVLGALYPGMRAAMLDPVEALNYE
jgi:putative ABC transport system permease protein